MNNHLISSIGDELFGRKVSLQLISATHLHSESITAICYSNLEARRSTSPSVIVIGGGFAGISAARALHDASFQVTLLESRNRVGGRVHTDYSFCFPVDLGASWLHGVCNENPLAPVIGRLGLPLYRTNGDNSVLYDHDLESYALFNMDGNQVPQELVTQVGETFETILEETNKARDAFTEDMSIQRAISIVFERNPKLRTEGWFAEDAETISLKCWDQEELLPGGHGLMHVFKMEHEEYRKEAITWSYIEFIDNQDVLDLIENKPIGVIALLDEACMFPKSIHDTFANKLFQNLHAHPRLGKAKFSETNFTISHYAGKVNYQTDSFLEKNRDYVVIDHCNLMSSSKCTFIAALFPTLPEESSRSYKFSSMASRFKQPATQGFIEYTHVVVPSSSAAGYLKDEHVSPDTVCHYGSDNTDSETVLQLRLPCGDHSKKEEVR